MKKKKQNQNQSNNQPNNHPANLPDFAEYIASISEPIPTQNLDEIAIITASNTVLMPGVIASISLNNKKSIKIIKKAHKDNVWIGVLAEKSEKANNLAGVNFIQEKIADKDLFNGHFLDENDNQNNNQNDSEDNSKGKSGKNQKDPDTDKLYKIGTIAQIIKIIELPNNETGVIVKGQVRFETKKFTRNDKNTTKVKTLLLEESPTVDDKHEKGLINTIRNTATRVISLNPDIPQEAQNAINNIEDASFLVYFLGVNTYASLAEKQELLELNSVFERATLLLKYMMREVELLTIKKDIYDKVHRELDEHQREYFLKQQMKVLQEELGYDSGTMDVEALRERGNTKKWNEKTQKAFSKELSRFQRTNPNSPEHPNSLNYLELMLELPWNEYSVDNLDLKNARKILDEDHFGLEKIKERILEYLAVLKLKNNLKAPILCFYGPPGVGKTSLGKSIAKALGREYVRMSLGGLHDEAEIRGHRKTYIGAMPGRIIHNIKKVGSSNPVFILDELDKISSNNFKGDPSAALLEVLDPEQNNAFSDNYLETEFDLSKVLFIATTNSLEGIHPALRDRMEIIEVSGYTVEEKVQIAKTHLISKQKEEHGLKESDIIFKDDAIVRIIEGYTRESGVRNLERTIGSVVRKIAKSVALEEKYQKNIDAKIVTQLLGAEMFDKEIYENNALAGVVTGLAWTSVGGEILFVEANISRGKGKLTLSGQLGDVMKESAVAALSYLKTQATALKLDYKVFDNFDLHIHVPAGAVPKDGPSAGITMLTAIASIFTQRKVKSKLAMTGEITLHGKVLAVGGLKEKILAAKRAGINEIVLSEKNKKDIQEIPQKYLENMQFHYVAMAQDVLKIALLSEKIANPMDLSIIEEKTK